MGDTIQKITQATGIDKVVHFLAGEDCGCEERRELLNKLFPYKNPTCMSEEDYNWFTAFQKVEKTEMSYEESKQLADVWNRVFQTRTYYRPGNCCPEPWQEMINDLNQVYLTYQNEEPTNTEPNTEQVSS